MPLESKNDITDLESSNHTLDEKFSIAHEMLTKSSNANVPQAQEIFLWFLNRKEELMQGSKISIQKNDNFFLHLLKCLQTHQISSFSVYQVKFDIIETLFQILNVKEKTVSSKLFTQCCLSILNINNFVKCLEQDALMFIKFSNCTTWLYSLGDDVKANEFGREKVELFIKMVSVIKKIKWNSHLSVHDMNHALVCVATLDYWISKWQESNPNLKEDLHNHTHLTLEQVFYSVITKDGSLCGILLTCFHDETILVKPEYRHIFNLLSLLEIIPLQCKGHIAGIIYSFLLHATYKLCDEYYGNVSFVFEKLDSFIRKEIDEYNVEKNVEVTRITQIEPSDHYEKMVTIYEYMCEFLVNNNISTDLATKKYDNLFGVCTKVSECIMYILSRLNLSDDCSKVRRLMDQCYSVLLSFLSFAPTVAAKSFPFFKTFVIYTQNRIEQSKLYGTLFAAILDIHFKMSKEVEFLNTLFQPETLMNTYGINISDSCWLPVNDFKAALHKIFSSASPERILSGWFPCIMSHFNFKHIHESCTKVNIFQMYFIFTSLVCTLEVTLILKKPLTECSLSVESKQKELFNDIKKQLGKMKNILLQLVPKQTNTPPIDEKIKLLLHKSDEGHRVLLPFIEIATYWGMFNMMNAEYNRTESIQKDISLLSDGDHALYLLHDYLDLEEWRSLTKVIRRFKFDTQIKKAFSELLAQSLDMLESHVTINGKISPQAVTSKFLVDFSDTMWLVGRAPLIYSYLNRRDQWRMARKLSKAFLEEKDALSLLTQDSNLHEVNVLVFQIAFYVLKQALIKSYDAGSDIGEAVLVLDCQFGEILQIATNEEKQSFLKKLWKTTEDTNEFLNEDTSSDTTVDLNSGSEDEGYKDSVDTGDDVRLETANESNSKRKTTESENVSIKKRKIESSNSDVNIAIVSILVDILEDMKGKNLPKTDLSDYLAVLAELPIDFLEPSSQHLLFTLSVLMCSQVSMHPTALISRFILGTNFSLPCADIIPFVMDLLQNTTDEVKRKLFKLCVKRADFIRAVSKTCQLTRKKPEDIVVHELNLQCEVTVHFLRELSKCKSKPITAVKNKIMSRALRNFKSLNIAPSHSMLPLYSFMLSKCLREHDSDSIQSLSDNLNLYLDLALQVEYTELIELALTYATLSLKHYLTADFVTKVWNKRTCANLCFQAASLVEFNLFLEEMFADLNHILDTYDNYPRDLKNSTSLPDHSKSYDFERLEKNFELWRMLLSSHLSSQKFSSRLVKLEAVITSVSTHTSLYSGENTQHLAAILNLVLDVVYSEVFVICGTTCTVHALFNLLTPQTCVYFKSAMKLLQYFINKKASIVVDKTALFLAKFYLLLSQVIKHVCHPDVSSTERDVLLLGMGKIAHAIRKEKKHFQRVVPYTLSNIMTLYLKQKFPIGVTVHMNEISNTFISICDQHGINFLKHTLPDSTKQIFLQTFQSYTKHHSQRFV